MSDSSKFVNAYIENSMGMIHDQVAQILQLKAQIKVTEDIVNEKDQYIAALQQEVENARNELKDSKTDLSSFNEKVNEVNLLQRKLEHMDTFVTQVNEMKKMIRQKDLELQKLKGKTEPKPEKAAPKKEINTKELAKEVEKPVTIEMEKQQVETDDF